MADYQIRLLADISQATKEISSLGKSVDKQLSGITSAFKSFSGVLAGVAATIGVGLSLKAAIDQASEYEDAVNALATSLKLTGIESQGAVDGIIEFASEIQKSTRLTDDAVISSASLLQSLARLSEEGLKKGTQAAIDLSAALRIDLDSATRLIGKAAEGNIEAFKRYGIEIQKGNNDAETFANTLKTLNDRFGGSAVAATNTYAGAVDQLRNNFNDVLKQFGLGIIQNKDFVDGIKSLSNEFVKIIPKAADFGEIVGSTIVSGLKTAKDILKDLPAIIAGLATAFTLIKLPAIITAFQALGGIIGSSGGSIAAFTTLSSVIAGLAAPIIAIGAAVGLAGYGIYKLVKNYQDAKTAADELAEANDKIASSLNNVNDLRKEQTQSRSENASLFSGAPRIDLEAQKKAQEQFLKDIQKTSDDYVQASNDAAKITEDSARSFANNVISSAGGFIEAVKAGASGVVKAFGLGIKTLFESGALNSTLDFVGAKLAPGLTSLVGNFSQFGGAIAGVAGQLFEFLAQGPEAVKQQIQAFVDNVPVIIQAVVDSIPVVVPAFIEALAANAGRIATALSAAMPTVANSLAISLITEAPKIAQAFISSLVSEAGRIIQVIADGIKSAVTFGASNGGGILKGGIIGGAIAGPVGAITGVAKKFKFAEGGIVPGGYPNDSFPAHLTSGEGIVPNDTMRRLDQFLSQGGSSGNTIIKLVVGEQELANVMLSLNQRGFRVS